MKWSAEASLGWTEGTEGSSVRQKVGQEGDGNPLLPATKTHFCSHTEKFGYNMSKILAKQESYSMKGKIRGESFRFFMAPVMLY